MAEILDIPEDGADPSKTFEMLKKNFATLTKQALKAGTYMLVDLTLNTTEAVTATAYKTLNGLSGSFLSSGGLCNFEFSALCGSAGHNVFFALVVDDVEVGWGYIFGADGTVNISRWRQLNAGNHKWQIKCKTGGGSINVGPDTNGINTTFTIIESLRG